MSENTTIVSGFNSLVSHDELQFGIQHHRLNHQQNHNHNHHHHHHHHQQSSISSYKSNNETTQKLPSYVDIRPPIGQKVSSNNSSIFSSLTTVEDNIAPDCDNSNIHSPTPPLPSKHKHQYHQSGQRHPKTFNQDVLYSSATQTKPNRLDHPQQEYFVTSLCPGVTTRTKSKESTKSNKSYSQQKSVPLKPSRSLSPPPTKSTLQSVRNASPGAFRMEPIKHSSCQGPGLCTPKILLSQNNHQQFNGTPLSTQQPISSTMLFPPDTQPQRSLSSGDYNIESLAQPSRIDSDISFAQTLFDDQQEQAQNQNQEQLCSKNDIYLSTPPLQTKSNSPCNSEEKPSYTNLSDSSINSDTRESEQIFSNNYDNQGHQTPNLPHDGYTKIPTHASKNVSSCPVSGTSQMALATTGNYLPVFSDNIASNNLSRPFVETQSEHPLHRRHLPNATTTPNDKKIRHHRRQRSNDPDPGLPSLPITPKNERKRRHHRQKSDDYLDPGLPSLPITAPRNGKTRRHHQGRPTDPDPGLPSLTSHRHLKLKGDNNGLPSLPESNRNRKRRRMHHPIIQEEVSVQFDPSSPAVPVSVDSNGTDSSDISISHIDRTQVPAGAFDVSQAGVVPLAPGALSAHPRRLSSKQASSRASSLLGRSSASFSAGVATLRASLESTLSVKTNRRRYIFIAIVVLLIAVGILLPLLIILKPTDKENDDDDLESMEDLSTLAEFKKYILENQLSKPETLQDGLSAQSLALKSMIQSNIEDSFSVPFYSLAVFYHSLDGDNWPQSDEWLSSSDTCSWQFVSCSNHSVSSIEIKTYNRLVGTIPAEILHLQQLTSLVVQGNSISAFEELPQSLKMFDLSDNDLEGPIPTNLYELSMLEFLSFNGNNRLNGTLSFDIKDLMSLQVLTMSGSDIEGRIPTEVGRLTNLQVLALAATNVGGTIPTEVGMLSNLEVLAIGRTNIGGQIPTEVGALSNIQRLDLQQTTLSGVIPTEVGNLSRLVGLDLSQVSIIGGMPSELGMLADLENLSLAGSPVSGTIATEFGSLKNLTTLVLRNSLLSGTLPSELGQMISLEVLELQQTSLRGQVPTHICALEALMMICVPPSVACQCGTRCQCPI